MLDTDRLSSGSRLIRAMVFTLLLLFVFRFLAPPRVFGGSKPVANAVTEDYNLTVLGSGKSQEARGEFASGLLRSPRPTLQRTFMLNWLHPLIKVNSSRQQTLSES